MNGTTQVTGEPIRWLSHVEHGSHYDHGTGVFLVPYDGIYDVNVFLYSQQGQRFAVDIIRSNHLELRVECDETAGVSQL